MIPQHIEQQFAQLIEANQGLIHKVCRMYCAHPDDRPDLFQEIVIQLWRAFPGFRGEAKLSTWMYRIALNTAISGYRKQRRSPEQQPFSKKHLQVPDSSRSPELDDSIAALHQAIAQLSEVEKALIMLYLEDLPYDEIAVIMGITQNNLRVKLNRIREKLKKIMTPQTTWNSTN